MMDVKLNYIPHAYQLLFHNSPARVRVVCAGRRFGKSLMACGEAVKTAAAKPKQRIWTIAPTFKLSEESWRILKEITPNILIKDIKLADRKIIFINESECEMKSADNESSLRGAGIDMAILDEASRIKVESYYAILPALSDRKGRSIIISTPRGRNWFFKEFQKGQDPSNKDYESWRFSSKVSPFFSMNEYDTLKENLPQAVFSQEVEASFIDDAASVFRNVGSLTSGSLEEPRAGEEYCLGVDLARLTDFTCLIVMNQDKHVVGFDRFQKLDWEIQRERILHMARKYNHCPIWIDSTGIGDVVLESLIKSANKGKNEFDMEYIQIQGYRFTNQSKNQLIQNLQLACETESISWPNIPILISEIENFEYTLSQNGNFKYEGASGHDDTVIALSLAAWGIDNQEPRPRPSRIMDISFR